MSKRKRNKEDEMQETEMNGEGVEEIAEEVAQLPELTQAEKKTLWVGYRKATREMEQAEKALEAAKEARSLAVFAILENMGRGPFVVEGRHLTIRKRGGTYFFTSPSAENATVIDF